MTTFNVASAGSYEAVGAGRGAAARLVAPGVAGEPLGLHQVAAASLGSRGVAPLLPGVVRTLAVTVGLAVLVLED